MRKLPDDAGGVPGTRPLSENNSGRGALVVDYEITLCIEDGEPVAYAYTADKDLDEKAEADGRFQSLLNELTKRYGELVKE